MILGTAALLVLGSGLPDKPANLGPTRAFASNASPSIPALYSDLYTQLSVDIGDFQTAVKALGGGQASSFLYAGQLTAANSNIGSSLLNPSSMTTIDNQLDFLESMGTQAVSVEVSFPMLYAPFLGSANGDWAAFYGKVAAAVRSRGMKLIVESQSMIPSGLESTAWAPQLQAFYPTLNVNQYISARASTAATVATTMQPDYFVLQEEPDTEATQAGQPSLGSVSGSITMLNASLAAVAGRVSGMKVGAGFGSWLGSYQAFANAFTRTACSSSQPCVSAPLDFLDLHLFPIIEHAIDCEPGVACQPNTNNFWQNTLAIVATARAANMHMTISQTWLRKVRDSEWLILSNGGDIEEAREAYSFWAPLDQSMLQAVHDLARYQGMYWVAPFNTQNYSAYLDWSAQTSVLDDCGSNSPPCGALSPAQIFQQVQSAAMTAMSNGTYSSTGQFWRDLIVSRPPAAPSR